MTQVNPGSGAAHPFVIPLTKIDVERRLVIGTAAEEIADKSREIMDYATARPQFEEWSNGFSTATGGLSKGNLRVMHTKTVAGRLDAIDYDDASKKVQIVAKVSDENEWQKCLDGAYTGFSIGGGYLRKWKDPDTGLTRYTPIVREISLVDNPCMPTATFAELVKADGVVEQLPLHGVLRGFAESWSQRPIGFAEAWARGPAEPKGPLTFGQLRKRAAGRALSDAEHQERIAAAKARWAHEGGHDLAAVQRDHDAAMRNAKSALFGRARKVRALQDEHDSFWGDIADQHEAYDKALPHLPANSHGLIVMGKHTIYDPTGAHQLLAHRSFDPEVDHVHGLEPHEVDETIGHMKREPGYDGPRDPAKVHAGILANRDATALAHIHNHNAMLERGELFRNSAVAANREANLKYGSAHPEHPDAYKGGGKNLAKRKLAKSGDDDEDVPLAPKRKKNQVLLLQRDWSAADHPRASDGRFAGAGGQNISAGRRLRNKVGLLRPKLSPDEDAAAQAYWDEEHARPNRQNVVEAEKEGAEGAALLGTSLIANRAKIANAARYGLGEKGKRNVAAAGLRRDRPLRSSIVDQAREARLSVLDGAAAEQTSSLADSARRKLVQEAKMRGSSEDTAHAEADRFARVLARKKPKNTVGTLFVKGKPTRFVPGKTAAAGDRAARHSLRGGVLQAKAVFSQPPAQSLGRQMLGAKIARFAVTPLAMAGASLAAQSAYRNQREAEGAGVTDRQHAGARVGDALRLTSSFDTGQAFGAALALPVAYKLQGGRFRELLDWPKLDARFRGFDHAKLSRQVGAGALLGGALAIANSAPTLYREYAGRRRDKDS